MTYALTGIPSSFRAPLTALQIVMGQGASNAPLGPRAAHYVVKRLASGATAASGTIYEINSEAQAATLFGLGSEGHRIARLHIKANPTGRLYMSSYLPSSGSGLASASATFTVTGPATATGSFIVVVCGTEIEVGYRASDSATTMASQLVDKILNATFLPVTASNSAGVVTVTAKVGGASQNSIHRIRVKKNADSGTGPGVTASAALLTGGVEGATTELSLYQAALAAIVVRSDYYIANPVTLATFVAETKSHVANKNLPNPGIFCRGFFPSTGSLSATSTITIAQNTELMQCVWQRNADQSPDEVLAAFVATLQKQEQVSSRYNFDNESLNGLLLPSPAASDWPTMDDIGDAVNDGISPIVSTATGTYLAMSITTRSKDSTGLLDDFRAAESHRISIMHEVGDTIKANHQLSFKNFAQQADPLLPDGSVDLAAIAQFVGRKTCPFKFKSWFLQQLTPFFDERLQLPAEWTENTICRIDPQNTGRMQVTSAGRTIDLHHQATFRLSETTPN